MYLSSLHGVTVVVVSERDEAYRWDERTENDEGNERVVDDCLE